MKLLAALTVFTVAANAGVVHQHHNRALHKEKRNPLLAPRAIEYKTVRVTSTLVVDQYGKPWPTPPPAVQQEVQALNVRPPPSAPKTPSTPKPKEEQPPPPPPPPPPSKPSPPANNGGDPDSEFPDGEIDCGTFPSAWGAIPVDWLHTDGWTGIQIGGGAGDHCVDDGLCSYACPPGYSKAQWPADQPESGESHGGLLCRGGKLYKTRPENNGLCIKGHGGVYVKNELSEHVPICRTDYPGSENMVVPLSCGGGSTQELTVPISDTYYVWKGKLTSAQYYVNPKGTSLEDGCVWGKPDGGLGNWSPMIFGSSFSDGITWLSLSQNQLNSRPLNYNVKIVGGPGSKLNGDCKYEGGVFSGGGPGEQGCTAALISGEAYYVLY